MFAIFGKVFGNPISASTETLVSYTEYFSGQIFLNILKALATFENFFDI